MKLCSFLRMCNPKFKFHSLELKSNSINTTFLECVIQACNSLDICHNYTFLLWLRNVTVKLTNSDFLVTPYMYVIFSKKITRLYCHYWQNEKLKKMHYFVRFLGHLWSASTLPPPPQVLSHPKLTADILTLIMFWQLRQNFKIFRLIFSG